MGILGLMELSRTSCDEDSGIDETAKRRGVMGILGLIKLSGTSCDGDSGIDGTVKDEL